MNPKRCFNHILLTILLLFTCCLSNSSLLTLQAEDFPFLVLTCYENTLEIGDEYQLIAVTSNGKIPTFKSSNSKVASVNTYGVITAKAAGTARITAKIKNAEGSCNITVKKTTISLSKKSAYLEHGETFRLKATSSTGHPVTFKTNKKSVATVSDTGLVTGMKPGEAVITATCDKTRVTCKVKVKAPTVKLSKSRITLYRGQTLRLIATVSSHLTPKWKSNRKSVATVSTGGTVTAIKHGYALVTATIDGVTKTCEVTVKSPTIKLNATEITLNAGQPYQLKAQVSSGMTPTYSSSNSAVASVDTSGMITTYKKGTATISVSEDGTKERCTVHVTE